MTSGETPIEDAPETGPDDWPEAPVAAEKPAVDQGAETKRFGFASRSDDDWTRGFQDWEGEAAGPEAADELPHYLRDDRRQQPRDAAVVETAPTRDQPPNAIDAAGSGGRETSAPGPDGVVSTPHIEHLRTQIGADASNAIEPWLLDEPAAPVTPTPQSNIGEPVFETEAWGDRLEPVHPEPEPAYADEAAIQDIAPPFLNNPLPALDDDGPDAPTAPDAMEAVDHDIDPMEDVAITIGRVVSIRGSVIWGALFDDIDGQAAKAARMGALVSMRGPESRVFGIVNRLEREQQSGNTQAERTIFEVQVLGEIADDRVDFQRGVSSYPPLDAPVTTITIRDIAKIYARPRSSNVHIGQLRHNPKVPAFVLTDSLLGKHFAVLGTTGTGKSCATTVILRSILDEHPQGHVVLIDPHNEYGPAFADRAELLHPGNLQLPYWLLNFEEIAHVVLNGASREQLHSQGALLKNAIIMAKSQFAGGDPDDHQITVDTPVPYRLSDLVSILKEGMGTFNKADGATLYLNLINRIETLRADKRFAFMFSSLAVRDNMEQVLAQLLRIPTHGKPITIIDISGLPSDVVDVVVSVLFRLTFELAVWSERGKAPPVLLVCEEAHRYVPEQSDVGFAPTKRVIAQIAKEGRKYGVTLCLVSQRPSELAVSSLAQCNTFFALRMSNEHDQAFVSQTLSENARWLVDSLPSLNTQEAVVVGDGVTVPVHIRFKDLPPEHRPASHDPSFAKSWRLDADDSFLSQSIDRWRRQTR
ncbi:MAG: helicase HerA domain-containing protein [Geminicoccaceae bacterium]